LVGVEACIERYGQAGYYCFHLLEPVGIPQRVSIALVWQPTDAYKSRYLHILSAISSIPTCVSQKEKEGKEKHNGKE
jgi:hypothetical protein